MSDRGGRSWLTFTGLVLVVAVLYWTQAVVVPIALAVLLTFLLTPPVATLQRWLGRVPGVLVVVVLTFAALGFAGWAVSQQLTALVQELPGYRENVRDKIRDVRRANAGGSVEALQETVQDLERSSPKTRRAAPPRSRSSSSPSRSGAFGGYLPPSGRGSSRSRRRPSSWCSWSSCCSSGWSSETASSA